MSTDIQYQLDGVPAGVLVLGTAGVGDTPLYSVQGSGLAVVTSGMSRAPAVKMTQGSGSASSFALGMSARSTLFFRDYFKMESPLQLATTHVIFRVSNSGTRCMDLALTATGRLRILNAANATVAEGAASSFASSYPDVELRREITMTPTSILMNLYDGDSPTPIPALSQNITGLAAGALGTTWNRLHWGVLGAAVPGEVQYVDNILVDSAATPSSARTPTEFAAVGGLWVPAPWQVF